MANTTALNLDKLLEGNSTFLEEGDRDRLVHGRLVNLFPKPIKTGWFVFGKLEYPKLTREQIRETLVRNHLVKENTDAETATEELLQTHYYAKSSRVLLDYKFVELSDGNGHKLYEFRSKRYIDTWAP